MRIERIEVSAFGMLSGLDVRLSRPVTLWTGRNEAGKTTLFQLIRFVLFGFPPRAQAHEKYEPAFGDSASGGMSGGVPGGAFGGGYGGAYGGALTVVWPDGVRMRVERTVRAGRKAGRVSDAAGCRVVLLSPREEEVGEAELVRRLGGLDAATYRKWFAFGLAELQELGAALGDLAAKLYGAGWGADGGRVLAAEDALHARMDELYRPRAVRPALNATLDEWQKAEAEARQDRAQWEAYRRVSAELDELEHALDAAEAEAAEARREAEWLAVCVRAWPHAARLVELGRRIAEVAGVPRVPDAEVAELERLIAERERLGQDRAALVAGMRAVEEECRRLEAERRPDAAAASAELAALLARAPTVRRAESRLAECRAEASAERERLERLLVEVGPGWTPESVRTFPTDWATREQVREFGRALVEAEAAVRDADAAASEARRRAEEARAACGRARDQVERWAAELTDGARRFGVVVPAVAPDDAEAVWETIRAEAARWRRLRDARAARLRVGASLAEERSRSARRSARRLRLAGAAFAGVTVVSAVLAGWAVGKGADAAVSLAAAIASAVLAVACAGAAVRAQRAARRAAGGSIGTPVFPRLPGAVSDEDAELAAAAERLKRYLPDAPSGGAAETERPSIEDLLDRWAAAAETAYVEWRAAYASFRAERERLAECERVLAEAEKTAEAARGRLEDALRRREELIGRWSAQLSAWGIATESGNPPSPDAVLDRIGRAEQAQELLRRIERLDAEADRLDAELAAFREETARLANPADGEDPFVALARRREEAERARGVEERYGAASRELERLSRQLAETEARLRAVDDGLNGLLTRRGATSPAELREWAAVGRRRAEWEREAAEAERLLAELAGVGRSGELVAELTAAALVEWEARLSEANARLAECENRVGALREKRGELKNELARLEREADRSDRLQKAAELRDKADALARKWATYAVAAALIAETRAAYERERQPELLRKASRFFADMTGGRYERVAAPVGENRLYAVRADGRRLDPAFLSRGTAEQMYLAMRLALAEHLAETRSFAPPLVLDDVFVHFDGERLERALGAVGDLARRHGLQVLMFTCHDHVRSAAERRLGPLAEFVRLDGADRGHSS